jgi:DNA ligase D-like protein (predicted polymerase)
VAGRRRERAEQPASSGWTAWKLASRYRLPELRDGRVDALGNDAAWRLEVAWDGHRVIVAKAAGEVRVFADDLREWTSPCQNIALTIRDLPVESLVLTGTLCVLDADGRPDFEALKLRVTKGTGPAPVLMVSDVLFLDDVDLTDVDARRARLPLLAPPLIWSDVLEGEPVEVLARVGRLKLPGVIASRTRGPPLSISAGASPLPLRRSLSTPPKVTSPDKLMFPRDGVCKRDVIEWYREIAPVFLPHLRGRPVVAQRWPDGIDDFTWHQHRPPPRAPDYLDAATIDGDRRLLIGNADALMWMVNQAALTFHTWSTRVGSLLEPDWAVIDLDPGRSTSWDQVIEIATAVRRLLELLEVDSVVKTSGQKGLHILVPLAPQQSLDDAHRFAKGVCAVVAKLVPDLVSLSHDEKERRGRLFLDHLQNFRGKTLVAPYSLRAIDGAPVSTPLEWDEVTRALDPKSFTRSVVLQRVADRGDLFEKALQGRVVLAAPLARLAGR